MLYFLLFLLTQISGITSKNATTTIINQWPMIMAHDAASTYLSESGIIKPWAKTQPSGGANGLLNCGARAFDWRPFLQPDGTIYAYHGDITIKHAMEKSLDEMIGWANANQNGAFFSPPDCPLPLPPGWLQPPSNQVSRDSEWKRAHNRKLGAIGRPKDNPGA